MKTLNIGEIEKKIKFKLDPWQKELITSQERHIAIRAGRQVGKSTAVSLKAALYALQNPKKTVLIIASVDRQAQLLFEKVVETILAIDKNQVGTKREKPTKHHMKLRNGTRIYCLPTGRSGYGIRGYTIDLLIADEAAYIGEEVWVAVKPMLITTDGKLILLSTPKGKGGFFYNAFKPDSTFKTWHITSEECSRVNKVDLAEEKRNLTRLQYAQEYLAEFLDQLMRLFPQSLIESSMILDHPRISGSRYLGLDVARFGGDENAFVDVVMRDKQNLEVVSIETTQNVSTISTIDRVLQKNADCNYRRIFMDDGGLGGPVFDFLLDKPSVGRKVVGLNNSSRLIERSGRKKRLLKVDMYLNLLRLMEQGAVKMIKHVDLKRSLESIQYEISDESQEMRIFGKYSHIAEALIRACWCVRDRRLKPFLTY